MKQGFLLVLAACTPPAQAAPQAHVAPAVQAYTLVDLVGGWRWVAHFDEQGTSRVEEERWRFRPEPGQPLHLTGRYIRTVDVRSLDRMPFQCDQRASYRQRALFDVTVAPDADGFRVHETAYTTEPSPCDHGFRKLGDYKVTPQGNRLVLSFANSDTMTEGAASSGALGGSQTLWQIDDANTELPAAPWHETFAPDGAWRWDASSYDEAGNVRDEHEWWQITRRSDTRLDVTYRRRVTVRSADGKTPIACAGAPSWSFDDAYVLEGWREEEHWHFKELAVEPGDHPCLRATPRRNLDEATAEQIGDYLVLEWRGKRREILYRPDQK